MKDQEIGDTKHASYYADGNVDPIEFGRQHGLNYMEVAIIKYATRWRKPGGGWTESLEKIVYFANRLKAEAECGTYGLDPNNSGARLSTTCALGLKNE